MLGDLVLEMCKPCTLAAKAAHDERQRERDRRLAARNNAGAAAAQAPDPRVELAAIEARYAELVGCNMSDPVTYEQLAEHRERLLAIAERTEGAWNGVDLEFRYITLLTLLAPPVATRFFAPHNKVKNRYANVIAPDKTLVNLPHDDSSGGSGDGGDPDATYINANYIDSLLPSRVGLRRYIAAQGPLANTTADFWLMLWHENVSVVAMLTQCVEKGRLKCEQYWPEADDSALVDAESLYGVMNVRLLQRGGDDDITERRFLLTHTEENRSRELVHFQYTEWPDWGVPNTASAFLRLVDAVDEHNVTNGPLVSWRGWIEPYLIIYVLPIPPLSLVGSLQCWHWSNGHFLYRTCCVGKVSLRASRGESVAKD